jgi:hypothetical protein
MRSEKTALEDGGVPESYRATLAAGSER